MRKIRRAMRACPRSRRCLDRCISHRHVTGMKVNKADIESLCPRRVRRRARVGDRSVVVPLSRIPAFRIASIGDGIIGTLRRTIGCRRERLSNEAGHPHDEDSGDGRMHPKWARMKKKARDACRRSAPINIVATMKKSGTRPDSGTSIVPSDAGGASPALPRSSESRAGRPRASPTGRRPAGRNGSPRRAHHPPPAVPTSHR